MECHRLKGPMSLFFKKEFLFFNIIPIEVCDNMEN